MVTIDVTEIENLTIPNFEKHEGKTYEVTRFAIEGNKQKLRIVTIPDSFTIIDGFTFSGCVSLLYVDIPDSIDEIGHEAFSGCTALEHISMSKSIRCIANGSFYGCASLQSIDIPDSVKEIGARFLPDALHYGQSPFQNLSDLSGMVLSASSIW